MAIKEWVKLKDGQAVPLERALAAFDLFVLHGRKGDFDEVRSKNKRHIHSTSLIKPRYLLSSIRSQSKFERKMRTSRIDPHDVKPLRSQSI